MDPVDGGAEPVTPELEMDASVVEVEDAVMSEDSAIPHDAGTSEPIDAARMDASTSDDAGGGMTIDPPEPVACDMTADCPMSLCCSVGGTCGVRSNAWQSLGSLPGTTLAGHVAVYDPIRGRILVHGGFTGSDGSGAVYALDVRPGSTSGWELLPVEETAPRRSYHAGVFDDMSDPPRLVVYGGTADTNPNSVWALEFPSDGATPRWTEIVPLGSIVPPVRSHHTAVFDSHRRQMIVYGGETTTSGTHDDLWTLSLNESAPTWIQVTPGGINPFGNGRKYHSAIYDRAYQRMIVYGGFDGTFTLNDTIALDLSAAPEWEAYPFTGAPALLLYHRAVYDSINQQMVVFGGFDNATRRVANGIWTLSLPETGAGTWSSIVISMGPSMRMTHAFAYDPLQQRAITIGGFDGILGYGDSGAISLARCMP